MKILSSISKISKVSQNLFLNRLKQSTPYLTTFKNVFYFSKNKKKNPQIKTASININKLQKQFDGFLIYENKESDRIKGISIAFIISFIWGLWTYSNTTDDDLKINYMIIGVLSIVPFFIFQFRTSKTLKRLVLDKTGQNIILTRYSFGGFIQQKTKVKVEVLRGIGKAFVFGGNIIKGGGIQGYEERNYWFHSKFIIQKEIFEQIVQGNRVKIDKTKIYE